ncbi:hypothetical protein D3C86_1442080 [compost metagenome]
MARPRFRAASPSLLVPPSSRSKPRSSPKSAMSDAMSNRSSAIWSRSALASCVKRSAPKCRPRRIRAPKNGCLTRWLVQPHRLARVKASARSCVTASWTTRKSTSRWRIAARACPVSKFPACRAPISAFSTCRKCSARPWADAPRRCARQCPNPMPISSATNPTSCSTMK